MLNPVVSCVVYAIELLIAYVFYSRISEKRVSSRICFIGGLVLFELGSLLNLVFHNNPWVNYIASIFIKGFFAFSFFEIKLFPSVCYAIILELLNFALELIVVFVISAFTHMRPADFNTNYALLMLECSMNKTLFFLTSLVLSGIVKPKTVYAKIPSNLFFYPISVTVCLGMFWYICAQSGTSYNTQLLLAISSLIIFGSTILLFITYQHQVEANSEYIRMKSEYNRLQTEKSYFDILEQQNENLLIYAHDTKKHLAAIQALSDDPTINEYITKLSDQLKAYTKNCHSGNMMLDVMINKYVMDCAHRGIHFEYNVRSCNLKEMEDIDLVAILGNLMDNALTSAERSKQKSILLETTMRNGYSVLVVVNSCDTPPSTHGGSLITSKEDKKIHGFGLKSVSKSLAKYHGDFSWEYNADTRMFTMTAMIGECKNWSTLS